VNPTNGEKIVSEEIVSEEPVNEEREVIVEIPSEEVGEKKFIKRIIRYVTRKNPTTGDDEVIEEIVSEEVPSCEQSNKKSIIRILADKIRGIIVPNKSEEISVEPRETLVETESKEIETESESEEDYNDSQIPYRVYSKNRRNKIRNQNRNKSFESVSRSEILPSEIIEEKEDESETYVNKKYKISHKGSKPFDNSSVEEILVEPITISETVVDYDSPSEKTLLNKKEYMNDTGLRNRKTGKKSNKRKSKKSKLVVDEKKHLSDDGDSFIARKIDDNDLSKVNNTNAENEHNEKQEKLNLIQIIIGYILYLLKLFNLLIKRSNNSEEENISEKPKFELIKSESSNSELPEKTENIELDNEKQNFRQRKSRKNRNRRSKQSNLKNRKMKKAQN